MIGVTRSTSPRRAILCGSSNRESRIVDRLDCHFVYGTVRTVVWEDGGSNPPSYPMPTQSGNVRQWIGRRPTLLGQPSGKLLCGAEIMVARLSAATGLGDVANRALQIVTVGGCRQCNDAPAEVFITPATPSGAEPPFTGYTTVANPANRTTASFLGDRQVRIYLKIDIFENGVVCDTVSVLV